MASSEKAFHKIGWSLTLISTFISLLILSQRRPPLDHTTNSLRPKNSPAYAAMEQIKTNIAVMQEPEWLLVGGKNESDVAAKLDTIKPVLNHALTNGQIARFTSPDSLWPRPEFQAANRAAVNQLFTESGKLREIALTNGFTSNSLALTESILSVWQRAAVTSGTFWPNNNFSRWVLNKATVHDGTNFYALGLIYSPTNADTISGNRSWTSELPREGVWVASWERLGSDLLGVVERDLWRVMLPMIALLLISLWLAFKRVSEVLLSLATLAFSGLCLFAVMAVAGWSWNLLNLLALPLLLGAGVDYSIHMQLALRRHGGSLSATRQTIGRALLLCAATTVAGFGSNAFSSNAGLESLGLVCAAGIACTFLVSFFLLPIWWRAWPGRTPEVPIEPAASINE